MKLSIRGLLHLCVTYVVWGSTYLGIRIAVREGAGWGPFYLGASRTLLAGTILVVFAVMIGLRVKPKPREMLILVLSGLLMWLGGNGAVNWAEQHVDSGLVALIIGSMPLWVVMMESVIDRRFPSFRLIASLLAGFGGLAVLTLPLLREGVSGDVIGTVVVIIGTICWGSGSLLLRRRPVDLEPTAVSGIQQLIGGVGFVAMALAFGESAPNPTPVAWAAWGYLLIFGSILAFTSFMIALKLLPIAVVMTYAYVNPVIAVLLGWIVLDEQITSFTIVGMALVLSGVYGVFREKARA